MWDIVGHDQALARLRRSWQAGHVAHAYLIAGPARVGKTTLALRLAQALNCEAAEPPCGQCSSCRRIASGSHPEVRTIRLLANADLEGAEDERERGQPQTGKKVITIEQVRDLVRDVSRSRLEGSYRVFTILDAELLHEDAANRLLKVLEEPPPRVVLLLTAADANILLPTVVSRCQVIQLHPVPSETIALHLREHLGLAPERAEVLARLSGGRVGWAIAAATDQAELAERTESLQRLVKLVGSAFGERFAVAGHMATEFGRERASVYRALDLWAMWWRDVLAVQAGAEELVANYDQVEALRAQARLAAPEAALAYVGRIEAARDQLEHNVNPRLAIESLLLNIPTGRAS